MATAGKLDLYIEQGALFQRTFQCRAEDGFTPVDLNGWTADGEMRRKTSITSSIPMNVSINGPTLGIIQWYMTDEETAAIPTDPQAGPERQPTLYTYDVELTDPSGQTFRVLEGIIEVSPEATR